MTANCRLSYWHFGMLWISAYLAPASLVSALPLLNSDFEQRGVIYPDRPMGWGLNDETHEVVLDPQVVQTGSLSLRSRLVSDNTKGFGGASRSFPVGVALGKRIHLKGWIQTQGITQGYSGFWMRVDKNVEGRSEVIAFDNMRDRGVTGTQPWAEYEIELFVDDDATQIAFGVLHAGNGTAWFDDIEFELDDVPYDPAAIPVLDLSSDELAWLRTHAHPIQSDIPGSNLSDLEVLELIFSGARIFGLGEGTHGTREFFRMKHRLVEWLVGKSDVTIFAIEASMPEARRVNEYVLTGKGDPREALAGMGFWTWNTEEVLNLIEWMHAYNASGKGRVEFWGVDMQRPELAAANVRSFVIRADPEFIEELDKAYSEIIKLDGFPEDRIRPRLRSWRDAARRVLVHLEANREKYLTEFGQAVVDLVIQDARIVEQAVSRYLPDGASRDKSMAINAKWILDQQDSDTQIVLWAHNSHVGRYPGMMGTYLSDYYNDAYVVVGFAHGEGEYTARGPRGLTAYPTGPALTGTIDYALGLVDFPCYLLDLAFARAHPDGAWLSESQMFRSIGSMALDNPFSSSRLAHDFDVLIYFDKTTPTRIIEKQGSD